jgi:hypothetical protein
MIEDIFKTYPYDIILQEEMDALPLSSDLLGLSKFKSQQSKIISVFDKSILVKEIGGQINVLRKSIVVNLGYIAISVLVLITLTYIHFQNPSNSEYLFYIMGLGLCTFCIYKAFDRGLVIKNLEGKITINDNREYQKSNIKDILIINRPEGASGDRSNIVIINTDNTYDRYDFTDLSEIKAIQAFRQWFDKKYSS